LIYPRQVLNTGLSKPNLWQMMMMMIMMMMWWWRWWWWWWWSPV